MKVWVLKRKNFLKKSPKTLTASELESQGGCRRWDPELRALPPGRAPSGPGSASEFRWPLSSPLVGTSVLFLVSCFPSPPCVLAGAHFCGSWPEGMFWSCQEWRRLWLAVPDERLPVLPVPHHRVKELRGAAWPGLRFPTRCVPSLPSATTGLSCPRQPCRCRGSRATGGGVALGKRAAGLGFQCLSQAPAGEKPLHFRSVTWFPALDQPLGHQGTF